MTESAQKVRVWEDKREIPTYGVGVPDKNPMFLEKRVYQGSTGKVYPYPVIDKIYDDKTLQSYQLVILENEYVYIEVMPELGGRIYRALDKTNNYDFVYYNRVIKPALVGLAGPWISGGIEFNWPQHHRPNTFGPVEYKLSENKDGSATVWVSEIDRMYGTKVTAGFTLYPGKAYLEIKAQLYNRTPQSQTFLWWANPAVAVNDHTQTIFPPDVHAVFDHGKRDVSKFPIATGTYYKMDYSEGVDISRYKNIPVPTSYMAYKSDYNFVGGYDHSRQAGLLHVANHHISPGKKQWTWGNGDFGQAWDRNLTDEDGPYIELMTGVYTDNQPDFSWLQPYEEKRFTQYFMPYKNVGVVKNATIDAAVSLEVDDRKQQASICVYTTSNFEGAEVELSGKKGFYVRKTVDLSPIHTFKEEITLTGDEKQHDLFVSVKDKNGRLLVSYQPKEKLIEEIPSAAKPLPLPSEIQTNEELYSAGLHLEQYRHATFEPEDYYLEGLKRDPKDIRINVAYGTLLLRRGLFQDSETHFQTAIQSLTWRNPNPYDSEAYYQLGLALKLQGKLEEAYGAFYKSAWSSAWQDSGHFSLAQIDLHNGELLAALDHIERSLNRNVFNLKARHVKVAILRKLQQVKEAKSLIKETLEMDIADFAAHNELYLLLLQEGKSEEAEIVLNELQRFMREHPHNYLQLASDYESCGLYEEAIEVLKRLVPNEESDAYPMLHYTLGYLYSKLKQEDLALVHQKAGSRATSDYCFPNTLFEMVVLEEALRANPHDDKANYYLGNLLYDKKRVEEAVHYWELSREANAQFSIVHRNLSLAYYNHFNDQDKARISLELAFTCHPTDARVFFELDQLYKKLGFSPEKRLENLLSRRSLVEARDDLFIEYITLLNTTGQYSKSIELLANRTFHPWEGGEGKVTGQYVYAHVELGKQYISEMKYEEAIQALTQALVYPHNLREGKLDGAQENHIHFYLGCAYEGLGEEENAALYFTKATQGIEEPASAIYYNDAPPDMIFYQGLSWLKLENEKEAKRKFNKLIDYGEKHLFDTPQIDYFAVSLPDFLVFEDDLQKRNTTHCYYMRALGLAGMNQTKQASEDFRQVLELDPNHQGAMTHIKLCQQKIHS